MATAASPATSHLRAELLPLVASGTVALATTWLVLFALSRFTRLRWTWAPLVTPPLILISGLAAPRALAAAAGTLAGALLATSYLIEAERRDERSGGDHRRRVRAKRGPLDTLRAHRERNQVASGPLGALDLANTSRPNQPANPLDQQSQEGNRSASASRAAKRPRRTLEPRRKPQPPRLALGEHLTTKRPVWLHIDQLRKHTLILGATGSGKSNSLTWLSTRAIRSGFGAIVLDMKGDPLLRERLAVEAGLNNRPYYVFRIEAGPGTQNYNPLRRGDATGRRDRLVASQHFSEEFYRGLFATHAKVVFDALDTLGREPTIATLCDLWDPHELKGLIRQLPQDHGRRLAAYLERLPTQQQENLVSSRARLDEVGDTAAGAILAPGSSEADEIDLAKAMRRRAVVVFSINADSYPGAGAMLGNLILQDLVGLVGELRQAQQKAHAICAVDEFGMLPGEQLGRLLSTARDVDLPVILAGQDLAQLRRVSEHFEAEVKANVCAVIAHRQSEPDSAEQIARMCGTEEVIEQTQQIDRRRGFGGAPRRLGEPGDLVGAGSQHYERKFRVGPDEVKDLETGEAVVRTSHPAGVHVLRVYRCEAAAEAAAWASVEAVDGVAQAASVAQVAALAVQARERLAQDG